MTLKTSRMLALVALVCCIGLLFAVPAQAQETVRIACTGSTVCNAAGGAFATQTTTTNPPTFNVSNTDGTKCPTGDLCQAYLAILVPSGSLPAGFTVNGSTFAGTGTFNSSSTSLWAALGETGGQDNTFSPWQTSSAAAGASITSSGSFTVYDFLLGTFTGPGSFSLDVTLSGKVPVGTGFAAFYEDSVSDAIVNNTALSESLIVVPEPTSMLLLGSGLLAFGGVLRRRMRLHLR